MIRPTTLSEQLLFTTVRIRVEYDSGVTGTGTGFFFHCRLDEKAGIPVIITNKHVVRGSKTGTFQLHEAQTIEGEDRPSGRFFTVQLDSFAGRWVPHPDEQVDLCAMLFQPLRGEAERQGRRVFNKSLEDSQIPSDSALEELSALEEVVFVGYPIGLWDEANNLPLIRRGTTASHPAIDFCGRSRGVIDAACFPGSSGSPVLILNEGSYQTKSSAIVGGNRALLLGVLEAGPHMDARGEITIEEIPTAKQPYATVHVMINLGYIVKARELLVLGEYMKQQLRQDGRIWLMEAT